MGGPSAWGDVADDLQWQGQHWNVGEPLSDGILGFKIRKTSLLTLEGTLEVHVCSLGPGLSTQTPTVAVVTHCQRLGLNTLSRATGSIVGQAISPNPWMQRRVVASINVFCALFRVRPRCR
jgi:hypothetical protein